MRREYFSRSVGYAEREPRGKIEISGGAVMFSFFQPRLSDGISTDSRANPRDERAAEYIECKRTACIRRGREREKRISAVRFRIGRLRLDFARKFDISHYLARKLISLEITHQNGKEIWEGDDIYFDFR